MSLIYLINYHGIFIYLWKLLLLLKFIWIIIIQNIILIIHLIRIWKLSLKLILRSKRIAFIKVGKILKNIIIWVLIDWPLTLIYIFNILILNLWCLLFKSVILFHLLFYLWLLQKCKWFLIKGIFFFFLSFLLFINGIIGLSLIFFHTLWLIIKKYSYNYTNFCKYFYILVQWIFFLNYKIFLS